MSTHADVIIKGAMLGDFNVGKSSIFQRFMHNELHYNPTIGVDFQSKTILHNGDNVRLHLWDTAGQERFRSIVRVYMRNIHVFFLVIDVTRRSSFDHLDYWLAFVFENTNTMHREQVQIVLLVNKTDTPKTEWTFTEGDVTSYCKHNTTITATYYVSAQTNNNTDINQMFSTTIQTIYNLLTETRSVKGIVDRRPSSTAKKEGLHTPPGSPPPNHLSSKDVMTAIGFNNYSPRTECCSSQANSNTTNHCCY